MEGMLRANIEDASASETQLQIDENLSHLKEIQSKLRQYEQLQDLNFKMTSTTVDIQMTSSEMPVMLPDAALDHNDDSALIKLDNDAFDVDGNLKVEEKLIEERAFELFKEAQESFTNTNYDEALQLYNQAISQYSVSPLLYARRGQTFLKLNMPINCVNDCTSALALVPDHSIALKFRGRAYMLMGEWDKAVADLMVIKKDEEAAEWLQMIQPMANKLESVRRDVVESEEDTENPILYDNIEAGDNFVLRDMDLSKDMQDPEVQEALEKNPKIRKLFKKMMALIESDETFPDRTEGDVGFSYFSRNFTLSEDQLSPKSVEEKLTNSDFPNCSEGVACLSDFSESNVIEDTPNYMDDGWLNTIRKHANFQDFTELETQQNDSQIELEEMEKVYTDTQVLCHGDMSD